MKQQNKSHAEKLKIQARLPHHRRSARNRSGSVQETPRQFDGHTASQSVIILVGTQAAIPLLHPAR